MKRIHVHIAVDDLDASIRFYSAVLGSQPTVLKTDYAKWLLEDPRVNLAISQRSTGHGLRHLGIQVESDRELADLRAGLATLDPKLVEEKDTRCCYSRSNKAWATDPSGIPWEAFYSYGVSDTYGGEATLASKETCCTPPKAAPSSHEDASQAFQNEPLWRAGHPSATGQAGLESSTVCSGTETTCCDTAPRVTPRATLQAGVEEKTVGTGQETSCGDAFMAGTGSACRDDSTTKTDARRPLLGSDPTSAAPSGCCGREIA